MVQAINGGLFQFLNPNGQTNTLLSCVYILALISCVIPAIAVIYLFATGNKSIIDFNDSDELNSFAINWDNTKIPSFNDEDWESQATFDMSKVDKLQNQINQVSSADLPNQEEIQKQYGFYQNYFTELFTLSNLNQDLDQISQKINNSTAEFNKCLENTKEEFKPQQPVEDQQEALDQEKIVDDLRKEITQNNQILYILEVKREQQKQEIYVNQKQYSKLEEQEQLGDNTVFDQLSAQVAECSALEEERYTQVKILLEQIGLLERKQYAEDYNSKSLQQLDQETREKMNQRNLDEINEKENEKKAISALISQCKEDSFRVNNFAKYDYSEEKQKLTEKISELEKANITNEEEITMGKEKELRLRTQFDIESDKLKLLSQNNYATIQFRMNLNAALDRCNVFKNTAKSNFNKFESESTHFFQNTANLQKQQQQAQEFLTKLNNTFTDQQVSSN